MVGTFPDGNSALMLVCAWLRHVAGTQWGSKKYMNMKHLESRRRFTGRLNTDLPSLFLNLRKTIDGYLHARALPAYGDTPGIAGGFLLRFV